MNSFLMPWVLMASIFLSLVATSGAAGIKTKNVVLITSDGVRWQEMFRGAEASLLNKENGGVRDTNTVRSRFWREALEDRRRALFPFLWSKIDRQGQIFGNQDQFSVVRVMNGRNFSYPGYNEFLCGMPDPRIVSNSKLPNPNTNVFEWLNTRRGFQGRVAATVNWEVIPWILNADRSRIPVWSGYPLPPKALPLPSLPLWIEPALDATTPLFKDVILDAYTAEAALHLVKQSKPRALYFAFGETDEWAHEGRYDLYLSAAHNVDRFIARLWTEMQAIPQYRDQTTFVVTTDHGRGVSPTRWKGHGAEIEESGFVWVAVFGPDTPPMGERCRVPELTQGQVASTVAALVGEDFQQASSGAAPPIREVLPPPAKPF